MENKRQYEIIVKGADQGKSKKTKIVENAISSPGKNKKIMDIASNMIVAKEIGAVVDRVASFVVSNVGLTTGSSESQERANLMYKGVKTLGIAVATGNPAVIGTILVSEAVNTLFNQIQINLKQAVENESLTLSRQRAGIAFNHNRHNNH